MDKQIIEISSDNIFLSLNRGFLVIRNNTSYKEKVPLDNILSVILSANNTTISKNVINAITEQGANVIFCGKNYIPQSITIPCVDHWLIAPRIKKQLECSRPYKKNLWKCIVQFKIYNQAKILELLFPHHTNIIRLKQLAKNTLSNDSKNNEGIAASIYFKSIFGKSFTRDRSKKDINILLNYAYTVLRAMVIRAICGNGLLPYYGIKHCAQQNPFPLADDLMEPFRAFADKLVFEEINKLDNIQEIELTPDIKRRLASLTSMAVKATKGNISLNDAIFDFVGSLVKNFESKKVELKCPILDDH